MNDSVFWIRNFEILKFFEIFLTKILSEISHIFDIQKENTVLFEFLIKYIQIRQKSVQYYYDKK